MRLFRRKPKFTHPCPICQHAGRVYPHGGQHAVAYPPPASSRPAVPPAPPPPAGGWPAPPGISMADMERNWPALLKAIRDGGCTMSPPDPASDHRE